MPWWIRLSAAATMGSRAGRGTQQEPDHLHGGGLLAAVERAEDQAWVYGDQFDGVGGGEVPGHPFGMKFAFGVGRQPPGVGPVGLGAQPVRTFVPVHDRVGGGGHDDAADGAGLRGGAQDAQGAVDGGTDQFVLVPGQAGWYR